MGSGADGPDAIRGRQIGLPAARPCNNLDGQGRYERAIESEAG